MTLRVLEIAEGSDLGDAAGLPAFQTRGYGSTGAPDAEREPDANVPFLGALGLAVRPLVRRTLRALAYVDRGTDEPRILALFDRAIAHATAVASGETRVYSLQTPAVCLRLLDGLIELRLTTGTIKVGPDAGEVQLTPGDPGTYAGQSVARNGDSVNASPGSAMQLWMAAVKLALPAIPVPPITIGTITGSLSRTKA